MPSASTPHRVSLYRPRRGSYTLEQQETPQEVAGTPQRHHRFIGLQPCSRYAACLELQASSTTCISTLTGEEEERRR